MLELRLLIHGLLSSLVAILCSPKSGLGVRRMRIDSYLASLRATAGILRNWKTSVILGLALVCTLVIASLVSGLSL